MASLNMTEFCKEYKYILWLRLMNASFINEFIRCFLSVLKLLPLPKHSCPVLQGKEEKLLQNEEFVADSSGSKVLCAFQFYLGSNLFKQNE
jgi:hypothetical protein